MIYLNYYSVKHFTMEINNLRLQQSMQMKGQDVYIQSKYD
jgi:hypothetical protein